MPVVGFHSSRSDAEQGLASRVRLRQPALVSVLAVFERTDDRGFFFGSGLRWMAVDGANTSRSAASQCCSAWPCTRGPHFIGAFANAVFHALVHVRSPSGLMMERP